MPLREIRESPELARKASQQTSAPAAAPAASDAGYFPGENMIRGGVHKTAAQPWPQNPYSANSGQIQEGSPTTATTSSPATSFSTQGAGGGAPVSAQEQQAAVGRHERAPSLSSSPATAPGRSGQSVEGGGIKNSPEAVPLSATNRNVEPPASSPAEERARDIPRPSALYPVALNSSMDFRKAGLDIETIGEYLAIQASESRARALLIMDRGVLTYDSKLKRLGKLHFDAFHQLESLGEKLAHQGRKMYLKGYEGSSRSSLRTSLKSSATAGATGATGATGAIGAIGDAAAAQPPAATATAATSSFLAKSPSYHNPLAAMFLFRPDFLSQPVISEANIVTAGREVDSLGQFLAAQALRYRTQMEMELKRAVDMKEKQVSLNCKQEGKLAEAFEKYGRKISKTGRLISAIKIDD